jgi:predicted phage terminase large subunit-like protein
VIDDPQSPETADTFLKRRRVKRWFGGTFMGLGADDWDIWAIGNLPHHDALMAELVLNKEYRGVMFRAINIPPRPDDRYPIGNTKHDGSALWPEGWSLEALANLRRDKNVGALGFAREMMNDPREEEDKPFDPRLFARETLPVHDPKEFRAWMKSTLVATATAVDPAGGSNPGEYKKGIRDWCVVVSGGRDRKGFIHIFSVRMTKDAPDQQMDIILDEYDAYRTKRIGVEEIMFKNLYKRDLQRLGRDRQLYPRVVTVKQTRANKQTRILGVQPALMDRPQTVIFAEHLFETEPEFFAMFDEFPTGHDDGPDATEMLVSMLEKNLSKAVPQGVGGASYWKGKVAS